jgi:hypothetical protein
VRFPSWLLAPIAGAFIVWPAARAGSEPPVQPVRPLVAVIDSGIARTGALDGALVAEYDMAAVPARPAFQPHDDHGTMVATILLREAHRPIGIVSFRIDDPAGCPAGHFAPCQADPAPLACAIRKATELGVSAINISLTLKNDPQIVDAIREASNKGIRVVLAAGNDGRDRPGNLSMAKAAFPNAVIVGALDAAGQPWSGTNRPEAGTPGYRYTWQSGVRVPTVLASGAKVYATGTSFAAPIETARLLD